MSGESGKLNGSVDFLAKAMRRVFVEAVQEGNQPRHMVDGVERAPVQSPEALGDVAIEESGGKDSL